MPAAKSASGVDLCCWSFSVEAAIWSAFGLNSLDLAAMPCGEVLERYCVAIRVDAEQQLDGIRIASYPHTKAKSQKEVFAFLKGRLTVGISIPDVYASCSAAERLRMIGAAINSNGADRWRENNGKELEWLESNGYSVGDAKQADEEWTARWESTGFFDPVVKDGKLEKGNAQTTS